MLCPRNLLILAMPLLLTMPVGKPRPFPLTAEVNCNESSVSPLVRVNLDVGYQIILWLILGWIDELLQELIAANLHFHLVCILHIACKSRCSLSCNLAAQNFRMN